MNHDKQTEAMKLALEALKELRMLGMNMQWHDSWLAKSETAITAIREALAEQPAQQEPVAWADDCRIELVTAIHFITSDYENALGAFGEDVEARRKAEGDIAHARKIASKWNWNGRTSPPASKPWVGLTDEEKADLFEGTAPYYNETDYADAIEAKLKEKNA